MMTEIMEYVREKLDWAAGRILELLTGSSGYKLEEVKVQVPDVREVVDARQAQRLPPDGPPCDRY
jgi:hypothetical protein